VPCTGSSETADRCGQAQGHLVSRWSVAGPAQQKATSDPMITQACVPPWLEWARRIQSLSQTGLAFSDNTFDTERYQQLTEIAAEIVETHTEIPRELLVHDFLAQPGYATPKVDVRAAILRHGQILLVQESVDQRWCMPGGWADVGESASETVVREVWEEAGCRVEPQKIIGVFDANRQSPLQLHHAYKIVFLCDLIGGDARPGSETLAVGFFSFEDLPPLSKNRTSEQHLAEVREHLSCPQRPAFFD